MGCTDRLFSLVEKGNEIEENSGFLESGILAINDQGEQKLRLAHANAE